MLERIAAARPRQVFVDIDFSSRAAPEDDAALAAALARFGSPPVILPTFLQHASGTDPAKRPSRHPREGGEPDKTSVLTEPLEAFARHARLGGVTFVPASDSLVRDVRTSWPHGTSSISSAVAMLSGVDAPHDATLPIDFSISPSSFDFISYVDLLAGRIAPERLHDRTVLIGATAIEHQATHDPLTGLPNRVALYSHLGARLARSSSTRRSAHARSQSLQGSERHARARERR